MQIDPLRPRGPNAPTRRADAAGGFNVPDMEAAPQAQRAAPAASASLDAVLALQSELPEGERRRRQIVRAGRALDGLDSLRLAILGAGSMQAAGRALAALGESLEPTGDRGLDDVLLEIETRRAVELAKLEKRAALQA